MQRYPTQASAWAFEREVCLDRHTEAIGEMIHVSVLQRMGRLVRQNNRLRAYRPKNVSAILDIIGATYGNSGSSGPNRPILIAGWDGHPLDPISKREDALSIVACARERLTYAYR
jgi:hypothetical protein